MVAQISVEQLKDRLEQADTSFILLDVREPWEVQICALPDAINIPMGQIQNRIDELNRDHEIIVACHHGIRSQRVALFLEHTGFDSICNLSGGIDAWAKQIDPQMAQY